MCEIQREHDSNRGRAQCHVLHVHAEQAGHEPENIVRTNAIVHQRLHAKREPFLLLVHVHQQHAVQRALEEGEHWGFVLEIQLLGSHENRFNIHKPFIEIVHFNQARNNEPLERNTSERTVNLNFEEILRQRILHSS